MNKGKPRGNAGDNHKPIGFLVEIVAILSSPETVKSFIPSPSISFMVIIDSE